MKSKLSPLEQLVKEKGNKLDVLNGAYGDYNVPPGVIVETFYPETGGTFTRLFGCSFLYKNYATKELMSILDVAKATLLAFVQLLNNKVIQLYIGILFLFDRGAFKRLMKKALTLYLRITYRPLEKHILELNKCCRVVRELDRVILEAMNQPGVDEELWGLLYHLKNIALMVIEYDNAYRIRIQDVLSELDINKLYFDPKKEVERLFDILIEREEVIHMKVKWKKIKKIISLLNFSEVHYALSGLNLEEIRLDPADHYFSLMLSSYNTNGAILDDRVALKRRIDEAQGHNIPNFKNADEEGL